MAGMEQEQDCATNATSCHATGQHPPCDLPSPAGGCATMATCSTLVTVIETALGPELTTTDTLRFQTPAFSISSPVAAPELPPPRA